MNGRTFGVGDFKLVCFEEVKAKLNNVPKSDERRIKVSSVIGVRQ